MSNRGKNGTDFILLKSTMLSGAHLGFKDLMIIPRPIKETLNLQNWPWIEVVNDLPEGKGVIAKEIIRKNRVICNYGGDLISECNARLHLLSYPKMWDYLFEFPVIRNGEEITMYRNHDSKSSFTFGKYLNHSKKHPNLLCRVLVTSSGEPDILFVSRVTIKKGQQLLWDYGDNYQGVKDCVASCSKCK